MKKQQARGFLSLVGAIAPVLPRGDLPGLTRRWLSRAAAWILCALALAACQSQPTVQPQPEVSPTARPTVQASTPTQPPAQPLPTATVTQPAAPVQPGAVSNPPLPSQIWTSRILDQSSRVGVFSSLASGSNGEKFIAYLDDGQDDLKLAAFRGGVWSTQTLIGQPSSDGWWPSVALDGQNSPHLSVYSTTLREIQFGSPDANGAWSFESAVQNTGAASTSLAMDAAGQPHILYFDPDSGQVRYAARDGGAWKVMDVGPSTAEGVYFPIKIAPDGQIHAAYYDGSGALLYATLRGDHWELETVDQGAGMGLYPSLAFDAQGNPQLSYYDRTAQALKFAARQGDRWQAGVVDQAGNVGQFSSIAAGSNGDIHIAYYDVSRSALKYALRQNGGWSVSTLDNVDDAGKYGSIALDPGGYPLVSYYNDTAKALMFAQAQPFSTPSLFAVHRSGQTFLTWYERTDLQGEVYRIYRSGQPIQPGNLGNARLLAQVGKDSARFYANRYHVSDDGIWQKRYSDRLIIQDNGDALPRGVGLLVWTLHADDFGGSAGGDGYYALTVQPQGGAEEFQPAYTTGPVGETVSEPVPVEITHSAGVVSGAGEHIYIQYMDLSTWNATFHAPNPSNRYYGLDPAEDPSLAASLQYAYDYAVYEPDAASCGGSLPARPPVMLFLHGYRANRYAGNSTNPYPYCAYLVLPIDVSETWYFGFARNHDYRLGGEVAAGDEIVNYTEQRVLRMLSSLLRQPPGAPADAQRIYVFGHSMGGSGALAFAQRYPNVFAAAYSGQAMTDYATSGITHMDWAADVAVKWGKPELNLPVSISAPEGWAAPLEKYNGVGVWDWQNYLSSLSGDKFPGRAGDEMSPLGTDHGLIDHVILWNTQGLPLFSALDGSRRAWAGAATHQDHDWSNFAALPVSLGKAGGTVPFWNLSVIRDETVPGLSRLSGNGSLAPTSPQEFNRTIKWSSSWDPWDGAPVDTAESWQMSLCSVPLGTWQCGGDAVQTVDVTPRRMQAFHPQAGVVYAWENRDIASGQVIASGTVTPDAAGLLTVQGFQVSPSGNRLVIRVR